MQIQLRNEELVALLSADFQLRSEPNFAWKSVVAAFSAIPALRGFWPGTAQVAAATLQDILTDFNLTAGSTGATVPQWGIDATSLAPYVLYDGTVHHYHLDHAQFDILGTETNIIAARRGLTIGGWFWIDTPAAANQGLISKWNSTGNQRSYLLLYSSTGVWRFDVSVDGTAITAVDSGEATTGAMWHFVIGRFDPSTALEIYVDGMWDANVAAIPASIFNSSSRFEIASYAVGTNRLTGRESMCFAAAMDVPDGVIEALWQQTRKMYGR